MEIIPYDKRSGKIWFNGKNVDWAEAQVHVLSHGLHYASCVFEGIRVYDGEVFKLKEHTDRLFYSAKRMGMNIPYNVDEINKKMFDRNIANGNLETLLDPRAQPTKYVMPFENTYPECRSQTIYYKQNKY